MSQIARTGAGVETEGPSGGFGAWVDHLQEAVVLAEPDGTLVHWNLAARSLHEIEDADDVHVQFASLASKFELLSEDTPLPPDQWPLARVLRGEHVRAVELRVRRHDRAWERVLRYAGSLVPWGDGRRLALLSIVDVTESRRALDEMRQSEERLRLANALGGIGTYDIDYRTGRAELSPELLQLYGVSQGSPDKLAELMERVDSADRANITRIFDATANGDEAIARAEIRLTLPSGESRWLAWAGRRYYDEHDGTRRLTRAVGAAFDVTAHRRAQQRLATRNAVAAALAESTSLSAVTPRVMGAICESEGWDVGEIWQLDAAAGVLRCVETWARPGRGLGSFCELSRSICFARGEGLPGRVWSSGVPSAIPRLADDASFLRRGPAAAHGLTSAFAFPIGPPADLFGVVVFLGPRPIHLDAEMRESFEAIARKIEAFVARMRAEAARALLEEQLRHAQKMEAIGQLSGGIAHDFNNLLNVIIASLQLARAPDADAAEKASLLADAELASHRATDLVAQILAFARQRPERRVVTSLARVVAESMKLLRATIPAGVSLETSAPEDLPAIHADETALQQVVMNLCTNAWHALEGRPGAVSVGLDAVSLDAASAERLQPGLRPGRYVRLRVEDRGKGMSKETLSRIFDPFFTTKPTGRGTGLGLSVVHGIVRSHEGAIRVESRLGVGSTFEVFFPAVDASPAASARGSTPPPPATAVAPRRILYLDDEEALGKTASLALRRRGYHVTALSSAVEALRLLHAEPERFDLIITDMNMPDLSGMDVLVEARRLRPTQRVIMVTGYAPPELRERANALGVWAVLPKPWSVSELVDAVGRALES
ncbi:MAG: ATP-binding protein [Sandaracinus sp.]